MALTAIPALPREGAAGEFTGAELLKWSAQNQRFYFQTSISMAGVIAAQENASRAECIDDWHREQNERKYAGILDSVRGYPDYHPQGVILAYLRKACGPSN